MSNPQERLLARRVVLQKRQPARLPAPLTSRIAPVAVMALAAALVASGCSTMPDTNPALELARSRLTAAQAQPAVQSLATQELAQAAQAFTAAEQAQRDGQSMAQVDHLSYLASQRVAVAQDTASLRSAQAVTASASAERDRMRLSMRTQEADKATQALASEQRSSARTEQELAAAQQSNATQAGQLQSAAQGAQDDQARLARRDAQVAELQAQMRVLDARKTERGMVVTLGDVLFSTGQSRLQGDGERTMAKLAEFLRRYPQRNASIEGFTDSVGSESANQALSDRRAQAVMDALMGLGVQSDRLTSRGFGEARPVATNASAEGRQMNRRVELIFSPEESDSLMR
jgi:outer membrane protein OmpA-like peptidoglycan-associated protein